MDRLRRAIRCRSLVSVQVLKGEVVCAVPACDCRQEIELHTIFELYARLYTLLDNTNYADYESMRWSDSDGVRHALEVMRHSWEVHMEASSRPYRDHMDIRLSEETKGLFGDVIDKADSPTTLLLHLMSFLLALDEWLSELKDEMMSFTPSEFPIRTAFGDVVPQWDSAILRALQRNSAYEAAVDPNYLLLSKKVNNFHVARSSYAHYEVKHQYVDLPMYAVERVAELTIGFLPGKWDLSRDYRIVTEEPIEGEDLLPFFFGNPTDEEAYNAYVTEAFTYILKRNPDIIMLPELFTPPTLREELKAMYIAERQRRKRERQPSRAALFLTGSYHEQEGGHVRNAAQVLTRTGNLLTTVYKMNRFILHRNKRFQEELAPFLYIDGVERNQYRRELTLFETRWGRMAFFICVDFITHHIERILVDRRVDIVFVMAMTPNPAGGKFIRKMQDLAERNGTIVVVCNQYGSATAPKGKKAVRIVVSLPGYRHVFVDESDYGVISIGDMLSYVEQKHAEKQ
ncbi:nitrilase-related carbon-nitrogen hydrolase [Paenibacillus sp.]|uniref:nitrilase-related carbon-nitrogen hydrolase n=1 Tax=Paenibacillus sp. TaxID=58172 RepID=UPI0028128794|nr:nitrilase-related carbon-nitrogen hydrolase [Paenibacillus sp.]